MANTELGDINTAPTGGVTPVQNATYQSYHYTFTTGQAPSLQYLSFLFRNDPGFTWLDSVSLTAQGSTANVLQNGDFEAGGKAGDTTIPGWQSIGTAGLPNAGALGTADRSQDQIAKPKGGDKFWVDGATGGYDGLTQQVSLAANTTYTLTFQLAVDPNGHPDINGPDHGIDTQVWIGDTPAACIIPCFLRGTLLATERGDVPVEAIRAGDRVITRGGEDDVLKPVVWVGSTSFDATRHPHPEHVWPIRLRAGALGEGVPRRDLLVSPGHALLLDDVLVQAERLVNGATIVRDDEIDRGDYFHVEMATHDILVSEGAPSESYLDTGNRRSFVQGGGVELYPDFSPRHWSQTCRPLVRDGEVLAKIRHRLFERAARLGWTLRQQPEPCLLVDGRPVAPVRRDGRRWIYALPRGASAIRLVSRCGVPAELLPGSQDRRTVGLRVAGVAVLEGDTWRDLPLDDAALSDGWSGIEGRGRELWRWTNGDAGLYVAAAREIELWVTGCLPVWEAPDDRDDGFVRQAA